MIQAEEERALRLFKREETPWELLDSILKANVRIMGLPEIEDREFT